MGFDPQLIIADWRSTYLKANGFEATTNVTYQRGWFVFESGGGKTRHRRFEVQLMILTLDNRKARP